MEYGEVLKYLSPCGLDCARCADYEQGEIKQLSSRLVELLGNYGRVAKMKEELNPIFKNYPVFAEILKNFAGASCGGCRSENVQCFIVCEAKDCCREKGLDFCFQCGEYPCEKQFSGRRLRELWKKKNDRMKEIGVVQFYNEQKNLPRY